MVSDVDISPDDSEGVVLAEVIESAKEIRPDNKKREGAPPRLGAGRLVLFSGGRRDKEGGPAAGAMMAGKAPQKRRYLISY